MEVYLIRPHDRFSGHMINWIGTEPKTLCLLVEGRTRVLDWRLLGMSAHDLEVLSSDRDIVVVESRDFRFRYSAIIALDARRIGRVSISRTADDTLAQDAFRRLGIPVEEGVSGQSGQ